VIRQAFEEFVRKESRAALVENFGTEGYFSAMARAGAMVGNSSSGLVEAASFALPVVNIGTRQQGRVRAENVIDAGYGREAIVAAIRRALSPEFRASLAGLHNPYGDGHAAEKIVRALSEVELGDRLVTKRFADVPVTAGSAH
jgi:UDP-N-acetylglucosamine 2-epimerase